jgi:hypothetical protein
MWKSTRRVLREARKQGYVGVEVLRVGWSGTPSREAAFALEGARYDVLLDPVLKGLQNQIHPPRVGTVLVHQGVGP